MKTKTGVKKTAHTWRTYDKSDENQPSNHSGHTPLWQIARATSAAPTYFESIMIGDEEHSDGTQGANNPSIFALQEVRSMHSHPPAVFMSIGCGKRPNGDPGGSNFDISAFSRNGAVDTGSRKQIFNKWIKIGCSWMEYLSDTEGPLGVQGWMNSSSDIDHKCRLNVEGNMTNIPLDEWEPKTSGANTLKKIKDMTEEYLSQGQIKTCIRNMAAELVNIRRERAKTVRWELFATDVVYHCPAHGCPDKVYKKRWQFRNHVIYGGRHDKIAHDIVQVERYLDSCRLHAGKIF